MFAIPTSAVGPLELIKRRLQVEGAGHLVFAPVQHVPNRHGVVVELTIVQPLDDARSGGLREVVPAPPFMYNSYIGLSRHVLSGSG